MRRTIFLAVLSAVLLAAAPPAKLDKKIVLMDPASGDKLLTQCSRPAPAKGERYFVPAASEIGAFEAALKKHLEASSAFADANAALAKRGWPKNPTNPDKFGRDIIGIERAGQRFIYGSYYPSGGSFRKGRTGPLIVCGGGALLFGAEYDLQKGEITHLAFNEFPG